jgi:hypothetical protein
VPGWRVDPGRDWLSRRSGTIAPKALLPTGFAVWRTDRSSCSCAAPQDLTNVRPVWAVLASQIICVLIFLNGVLLVRVW